MEKRTTNERPLTRRDVTTIAQVSTRTIDEHVVRGKLTFYTDRLGRLEPDAAVECLCGEGRR